MKKEKREEMMMEGIDMNEFMPKMMASMLKDLSVDDVIEYLKNAINDNSKIKNIGEKILEMNPMPKMMMKTYTSKLGFDETIEYIEKEAPKNEWIIPEVRDLQSDYINAGIKEMTRLKVIYFCNPTSGYGILKNDDLKSMSVMMPMGVSVYETTESEVKIAAMNLGMMSKMFAGETKEILSKGATNFGNTIKSIITN
ncbi:DUF302 domain-containing protein [Bacteroidota bacterium]